jgi:hypothetical protein
MSWFRALPRLMRCPSTVLVYVGTPAQSGLGEGESLQAVELVD